jgi:hypothetical protein
MEHSGLRLYGGRDKIAARPGNPESGRSDAKFFPTADE